MDPKAQVIKPTFPAATVWKYVGSPSRRVVYDFISKFEPYLGWKTKPLAMPSSSLDPKITEQISQNMASSISKEDLSFDDQSALAGVRGASVPVRKPLGLLNISNRRLQQASLSEDRACQKPSSLSKEAATKLESKEASKPNRAVDERRKPRARQKKNLEATKWKDSKELKKELSFFIVCTRGKLVATNTIKWYNDTFGTNLSSTPTDIKIDLQGFIIHGNIMGVDKAISGLLSIESHNQEIYDRHDGKAITKKQKITSMVRMALTGTTSCLCIEKGPENGDFILLQVEFDSKYYEDQVLAKLDQFCQRHCSLTMEEFLELEANLSCRVKA